MVSQYAFFFDASACTGCKACQVACQDRNDLEAGLLLEQRVEGGAHRVALGDEGRVGLRAELEVFQKFGRFSVACSSPWE